MTESDVVGVTIDRSHHTVLVVDDNPATRYATARTLRAAGFLTLEAATGEEALRLAAENVSAVVLDVHLPDMDGFEVCQQLRQRPDTAIVPVIHLSATYVEDKHKVAGLNAGADAYITHPAEPPILIATVQALVRAHMAEDRLRRSEAKFRAIYTQAETGIALVDSEGRFTEANPAMLRMLGRQAQEVFGRPVSDFAPPEWKEVVQRRTAGPQDSETSWHEAFPLLDAEGHIVHLDWTMSPHVEPGLRIGVVTNVSARLQLEQRRQQLLEREQAARVAAEHHSQTKDDFIAVLSHELRNPLNAMIMAVQVLLQRDVPPDVAKVLGVIQQNADAQARLISDILDVSRINSGKLSIDREYVDPGALITNSIQSMKAELSRKDLQVDLDLDDSHTPTWLDPTRFQQIFWNIFTNALKFSNRGGVIQVSLRRSHVLALTVRDFGKGMEPEFIKTIFDKFSQADSPVKRSHQGLGLGMSIVKHLVELHSGTIVVESEGPGHGTTVRVEIPLLPHVVDASSPAALHAVSPDDSANLDGLHIAIIEDNLQTAEMLSVILRDRGAAVVIANDYDSALSAIAHRRPDILVGDIGLVGRDGYELIREVRRQELKQSSKPIIAIALTAFGRSEDRQMALSSGFDAHIAKPLQPQELISSIRYLLQRQKPRIS